MKSFGWNIVILSFTCALLESAQVPKTCSAPPEYPQTRLDKKITTRKTFKQGDKVYYNCAEDFIPYKGNRVVQCIEGQWSKLTLKCEKMSCGNAGDLPNGQFIYEGSSLIGEKVYAECNEGYTVKGLNYMICKKSGWTGERPSCEVGETTCSIPVVANSVTNGGNGSVYRVEDNMTFTCSQGFRLDGPQKITCGPDGQWQPQPPLCLPSSKTTRSPDKTTRSPDKTTLHKTTQSFDKHTGCGVPPAVHNTNANLADKYITKTSFASGDRVQYVCDVGYVLAGGRRFRTCNDGKWTPLRLKCERKLCGSAGDILNGHFEYTGVEFGDKATAVCNEGYTLVGQKTRNCMSNGWDARVPDCEAVECADPPEVPNAVMEGLLDSPYTYRSVVRYQCRVGTLTGQKELYCTKDGTWSAPPPKCKESTCPHPKVPNAAWRGPANNMYQYRETISIDCNRGYILTGPRTVTCGGDGRWFPGLPKCTPKSHPIYVRNRYPG